ncbi:MAG: hypothetical protein M0R21_06260 [Lentimicrobiaceae bacterium]|nr:hypothetical protein [Lentimicrobiaceae bacterium]
MNLLNNLFKEKKLTQPLDMGLLGVDMHSHLIPGIDDGVKTLEESVDLIRRMSQLGFRKLITTPHIQGEFFTNTPEIILNGLEKVKKGVKDAGIPIIIEAAAEYLMDDRFEEKYKNGKLMTFGNNYVLVELSYYNSHPNLKQFIFDLQIDGYKVILAHIERYSYWFNELDKFQELKERGVFLQINTISLGGYYNATVKKIAEKLVDKGLVDFLGTDMHNFNYMHVLEIALREKYVEKLLNSGKLLNSTL